jgi:hypothetical protein
MDRRNAVAGTLEASLYKVSHTQDQDNNSLFTESFLMVSCVNFLIACRTRLWGLFSAMKASEAAA